MEFIDGQMKEGGIVDQIITNLHPNNHVYIQMDNVPAHTGLNTIAVVNGASGNEDILIEFVTQPAQSPDFKINDLNFSALFKREQVN